jgi:hypothetical protein
MGEELEKAGCLLSPFSFFSPIIQYLAIINNTQKSAAIATGNAILE